MVQFLGVRAAEVQDRLQGVHCLLWQAFLQQFFVYIVNTYLVQFVYGYGYINNAFGLTNHFGYTCKDLSVVNVQRNADTEAAIHLLHNLNELHFAEQGVRAYHIHIALIELAVATFLWTVSTPYGLYLIALEGELYLLAMLHHEARKGYGQVVAQAFLADLGGQCTNGSIVQRIVGDGAFPVA